MINAELIKAHFLRNAKDSVVLKQLKRSSSKLNAKPEKSYKEIELSNCIVQFKKANFKTEEAGSFTEQIIHIIRLDDGTRFQIGDRIQYLENEYILESPVVLRASYGIFQTILVEAKFSGTL